MGLGLQKWIYQQKPRRFFSQDRKPFCSRINQPRPAIFQYKSIPAYKTKEELDEYLNGIKQKRRWGTLCSFFALIVFVSMIFYSMSQLDTLKEYNRLNSWRLKQEKFEKNNAYNVMVGSGRIAYLKGNYVFAYDEFIRAHRLFPKAIYHKVYFAKMYLHLYEKENLYCEETQEFIAVLNEQYCGNPF